MAYLQGYQQPNVLTLAPDAKIFINGRNELGSCTKCNKKFQIDNFTNISITLNVDGTPGGATFSLTAPRHEKDRLIQFDQPIIKPMHEVEIFMKGRFKDRDTGDSLYYPVFWGVVSNSSYSFSGGFHSLDISCKDILRFWEITKVNLQPGAAHQLYTGLSTSAKGSIFHNMNPFEIIYSLNYLVTAGAVVPASIFTSASAETIRRFKDTRNDLMDHWKSVFATTRDGENNTIRSLRMVGFSGEVFFDQRVINRQKEKEQTDDTPNKGKNREKALYTKGIPRPKINFDGTFIGNFHPLLNLQGSMSTFESEVQSRLEIATQIKNRAGFEFFMDTTGDIVFKPPFYNMDIRDNPFYVIEGSDIISISFDEDETAVEATRVDVSGKFKQGMDLGDTRPLGTFLDHNLARKFGLRDADTVADFLSTKESCFTYAADYIEKLNNYIAGSVTIPLRAELRMGYPIYLKPYDTFAYIKGIAHTFTMGGPSTTTITLEKFRRKYIAQEGNTLLGTDIDPKGNFTGSPNRSIFLTKTQEKTETTIKKKQAEEAAVSKRSQNKLKGSTLKPESIVTKGQMPEEKGVLSFSRFQYSNLASKTQEITGSGFDPDNYLKDLESELPVSDENGYELIGVFPYGRNMKLTQKSDGAINLVSKNPSSFINTISENSKNLSNIEVKNEQKQKKGTDAVGQGVKAIERFNLGGAAFKLSEISPKSIEGSGQSCKCQQRKLERILQAVKFRRG